MPTLLERPRLIADEEGRPVLKAELDKRKWSALITCGELSGKGCGAKSKVVFDDIFKEVQETPMMTQIGYRAKCMHCHGDIMVAHQDTPWHHEAVPAKVEWLKHYMSSLVETLHKECDAADRGRLKDDLVADGTKDRYLTGHDWS